MHRIDQTVMGFPNGNCLQACISSLFELELDEVPNFIQMPEDSWYQKYHDWCNETFGVIPVAIKSLDYYTDCLCIASGKSPRGDFLHAVVWDCQTRTMVHDPHPSREGIVGTPVKYTIFAASDPALLPRKSQDKDCSYYAPGKPHSYGSCEGTGYYLCDSCSEKILDPFTGNSD